MCIFAKVDLFPAALPLLQSSNQWAMMQEKRLICTGGRTAPAKECAYDLFACIPDARPGGRRGILLRSPEPADLLYRQRALSCIPLLPSAAAPTSHSPRGPDHHQRRCLPATCRTSAASTAASTPPGPASGRRWTMCGSAGRLSEAGGRLPLHPKTRRSRAARYFDCRTKKFLLAPLSCGGPPFIIKAAKSGRRRILWQSIWTSLPSPSGTAHPLRAGGDTDQRQREMVDLVCRFLNPAAAALLGLSPEDVQGRRLSQLGPERALEQLRPCRP